MKRIVGVVAAAVAVVFAGGSAVDAYPLNTATVTVSNPTPAPGATFEAIVSDCLAGTPVDLEFQGQTATVTCDVNALTQAVTQEAGGASTTFTAPMQAGTYDGSATVQSGSGTRVLTFSITVQTTTPTTNPSGGLPPTGGGSSSTATMTIAVLLLVAGTGMFAVANLRRRSASAV